MSERALRAVLPLAALLHGCTCLSLDDLQSGIEDATSSGASGPGGAQPSGGGPNGGAPNGGGPNGAGSPDGGGPDGGGPNGAGSPNGGAGPGGGEPNGGGGAGPGTGGAGGGNVDAYEACITNDSPAIFYRMDSAGGTEPNLGSFGGSASYTGSVVAAPALTHPFGGLTAKKFNSLASLEEETNQFLGGFQHVTIESWVRIGSTIPVGGAVRNLFDTSPSVATVGVQPRFDGSGMDQLFFSIQDGARLTFDNGNFIMQPSEVFHIVAVYRQSALPPSISDDMLLYVNGQLTSIQTQGDQVSMGAIQSLRVGGTNFGSAADGAEIDEFAMYTYELTPSDVSRHFEAGTTGNCQ